RPFTTGSLHTRLKVLDSLRCKLESRDSRDYGHSMIRILIADDHAIVRAGLRQFIADQVDMEVAAEAASGSETVAAVRAAEFDVVLLDISMPDKNGIDTLRLLRHVRPELPVLMLSAYGEDQYAVNLLRAGASGYLNKEAASTQLVGAIRTVVQGRKYVSPSLAQIRRRRVGRCGKALARGAVAARVPDLLQARGRCRRVEDRRRAQPVREDGEHLSHPHPREDGDEVERRP